MNVEVSSLNLENTYCLITARSNSEGNIFFFFCHRHTLCRFVHLDVAISRYLVIRYTNVKSMLHYRRITWKLVYYYIVVERRTHRILCCTVASGPPVPRNHILSNTVTHMSSCPAIGSRQRNKRCMCMHLGICPKWTAQTAFSDRKDLQYFVGHGNWPSNSRHSSATTPCMQYKAALALFR